MLESIDKIERYTAGLSFDQFEANEMVVDAVVRNLEIIGKAAGHIPPGLREQYSQIEWSRVIGFRNIVIHALRSMLRLSGSSPRSVCPNSRLCCSRCS